MKRLQPFDDFWISCGFNSKISILRSIDDSYNELAYFNNYSYNLLKEEDWSTIALENDLEKYIDDLFETENITLKNDSDDEVKNIAVGVGQKNIVFFLGVELYEWVENSISWHKNWYHYSLVVGYDEISDELIVFDDDLYGYNSRRIPYNRVITASKGFMTKYRGNKADAYYLISKNIESKFKFTKKDLIKNSICIIKSLDSVAVDNLNCWEIPNDRNKSIKEYLDIYSTRCYQFENRQKGNLIFFNNLFNNDFITLEELELLTHCSEEIMKEWKTLKNRLIKMSLQVIPYFNYKEFVSNSSNLFNKEKVMWQYFCNYIEPYKFKHT